MSSFNRNSKKYWDIEWQKRPEVHYPFFPLIKSLLKPASTILDVGAGIGTLKRFLDNQNVICTDISEEAIKRCGGGIVGDFLKIEIKGRYDYVLATEFLEHVDDKQALARMVNLTDTVIVSVPNDCLGPEEEPEHLRKYTPTSARELFKQFYPRVDIWPVGRHMVIRGTRQPVKTRLLLAVLNQGQIRAELANNLIQYSHDDRYDLKIYYPTARPIENNRNQIARKVVEEGWDYVYMVDDDTACNQNPLELIELDLDIIGLPCRVWQNGQIWWNVMREADGGWQGHITRGHGLKKVDAVGTGQIIIARRVLEAMKHPFEIRWTEDGILDGGLDFVFCQKAIKQGFNVYAHWDYCCSHWGGEIDFSTCQV